MSTPATAHFYSSEHQAILNRVAALWAANPEDSLVNVLFTAHCRYHDGAGSFGPYTDDAEMVVALDRALAAAGVTVSGGWTS